LANRVQRDETHQRAIYRQNRSIGCENILIFRFFKMAAVRHLEFVWDKFGSHAESTITLQNLIMIDAVDFIWTFQ